MRATFSEAPDPKNSSLEVFDVSGKRVDKGDTAPTGEPNELRVSLQPIGDGGYTVAWTIVSSVDGHQTKGSFAFAVGNAELPKIVDVPNASPAPRPIEIAGRILSYAGIALILGPALFGLVIRQLEGTEERRARRILVWGGALLAVGAVTIFLDQGLRTPGRLTGDLAVRALAAIVAIAVVTTLHGRRALAFALGASVVAALSATAVSHAAAAASIVEEALDIVHLLAASAWAGGVVAVLAVVAPSEASRRDPRAFGATVWRFSVFAMILVIVIVLTGTIQALTKLVLVQDLWETPYGLALLAKIVLLCATLVFGALNLLVLGPRLRGARDALRSHRWLIRSTLGETVLLAGILAAAGILTALAPPATASGVGFDETKEVDGLRLELLVPTLSPGQNRYVLRVHQGLSPVTGALKVAFRFNMIEHDMGESELVAKERAPGEYAATGNATVMNGTWRIQAIVRLEGRTDVTTTFDVPISTPTGPGSVAKVVNAPPYALVVYIDPPQPVAGAPDTLNIVVVNDNGDPVQGKAVRVTLAGPSTLTVDAKESSPGHYEAAVAALDAGKWTATIAVGSEAKGDYQFDVSR